MATYNQNTFLKQFDQPIRKYIIEYCKKLSATKYDVYILLARKAACLLTTLEDLGFVNFDGLVVSDRILEYDTKWLEGKKIAIIDDTIISGTSICKIIRRLKSINVASINVHAFCINDYWYSDDMLKDGDVDYLRQPYMRVNHTSSIRFCKQIVDALSIVPRPYNIDFPVYDMGKLSRQSYLSLIEDDNWKVVNTASLLQEEYHVGCASFNFKRELLNQFNEYVGCDLTKVLFVKLRLFTKELFDNVNNKQSRYLCKVVPYVIFNPIKTELAPQLVEAICKCENVSSNHFLHELNTDNAKLLFIQYYFAARLVNWWVEYTEKLLHKTIRVKENRRSLNLLFSPSLIELINEFTFSNKIALASEILNQNVLCNKYKLLDKSTPVNPFVVKSRLTRIFLDLYYNKELSARRIVKDLGKKAFEDKAYQNIINRLDDGITIDRLRREVSNYVDNATDRNLMLSTFLDNAIDKGLIVPITSIKDGYVYRGFRHGEEIIWGDSNDKLLAKYMEGLYGKDGVVPKFMFEKLLVIFCKIGLRQGFLSEYDQSTPPNQKMRLTSVRAYKHGQVSIFQEVEPYTMIDTNPILKDAAKAYWTTKRLADLKYINVIRESHDNSLYQLNFDSLYKRGETDPTTSEDIDLDPGYVDEVLNLTEILQLCINNKLIKNPDGFIILTSCMSLHDNTSSIGAELQIYNDTYLSYYNRIVSALKSLTEAQLYSFKEDDLFKAINSGFFKYNKFRSNKGVELVEDIKDHLDSLNTIGARKWKEYWRKDLELLKTHDPELKELNNRMGLTIIDILISLNCLHLLLMELLRRDNPEFGNAQTVLENLKEEIKRCKINKIGNQNIIKTIENRKEKLEKSIKKQKKFIKKSLEIIRDSTDILKKEEKNSLFSSMYYDVFLNESYKKVETNQLKIIASQILENFHNLKNSSREELQDYESLVPQWGKVARMVSYSSFLHFNTVSEETTCREKIGKIIKAEMTQFELDEYEEEREDKSIVILRIDDINTGGKGYVLGSRGIRHDERLMRLACRVLKKCNKMKEHVVISYCPYYFAESIKGRYNTKTACYDSVKEDLYKLMPENRDEDCINVFIKDRKDPQKYMSEMLTKYSLDKRFQLTQSGNNNLKYKISMKPYKIFISYSRKDVEFKNELKKHLKIFDHLEIIDTWSCEEIKIGRWNEQIQQHLEESDLVIYMLSSNFLSSKYILEHEVQNVITNGNNKNVLCVMVSKICDQEMLEEFIANSFTTISNKQKAVMALKDFQYLPYGMVKNNVSNQYEESIVPLKEYDKKTDSSIEEAFSQIINKIMILFNSFQ